MKYAFEDFLFDAGGLELLKGGAPVHAQPRALAVLKQLLRAAPRTVSKDQLIETVWRRDAVSDGALSVVIQSLRASLSDSGREQRLVRTVHRKGFRFVGDVVRKPSAALAPARRIDTSPSDTDVAGSRPSIAVLPFMLIGGAGEHASFAQALPDEVISALSKLRWLQVTARGSSFQFASYAEPPSVIGEKLGARYCLSGTIEITGDTMRIAAELSDTRDDAVVWGDEYHADLRAIYEIRAEIVGQIASQLAEQVTRQEIAALQPGVPSQLKPWEAYHLGIATSFSTVTPDVDLAEAYFGVALEGDPRFSRAHAGLSNVHYLRLFSKKATDEKATVAQMLRHADRSREYDPLDPFAHLANARAKLVQHDIQGGVQDLERAKKLCPSYALAYSGLASIQALEGQAHEARENLRMHHLLSPLDPWRFEMYNINVAIHLALGEFDEAADWSLRAIETPVPTIQAMSGAIMAMFLAQRKEEGAQIARKLQQAYPGITHQMALSAFPTVSENNEMLGRAAFSAFDLPLE